MASSSASGLRVAALPSFLFLFPGPSPHPVEHHIARDGVHHDIQRFVSLPDYPGRLSILHNNHARDTALGTFRKSMEAGSIGEGMARLNFARPVRKWALYSFALQKMWAIVGGLPRY